MARRMLLLPGVMSWLRRSTLALVVATSSVCCASSPGDPFDTTQAGDICSLACERRNQAGCVVDVALCTETCAQARSAGYCSAELDSALGCVAVAKDLHCGRAPNGGSCDTEGILLEHCLSAHSVGEKPPDCYGKECSWECGPIGKQLCTPERSYLCECPSGASGTRKCANDGCFWLPCDCQKL